jgi:hypothetical protein
VLEDGVELSKLDARASARRQWGEGQSVEADEKGRRRFGDDKCRVGGSLEFKVGDDVGLRDRRKVSRCFAVAGLDTLPRTYGQDRAPAADGISGHSCAGTCSRSLHCLLAWAEH